MMRKTLLVISLVLLAMTLGLWGVSYFVRPVVAWSTRGLTLHVAWEYGTVEFERLETHTPPDFTGPSVGADPALPRPYGGLLHFERRTGVRICSISFAIWPLAAVFALSSWVLARPMLRKRRIRAPSTNAGST